MILVSTSISNTNNSARDSRWVRKARRVDLPRVRCERGGSADYFFQDVFEDELAAKLLLGPMPASPASQTKNPPSGLPAYLQHLWTVPLLTEEQEYHCFRKLNYIKHLMNTTRANAHSCMGCAEMLDDIDRWKDSVNEVRNLLIESNLRLVVSLAKKYAGFASDEFDEMISVGNEALMRAVDLFDFRRGIRFCTYAYQAIQRSIFGVHRKETRIKGNFIANGNEAMQSAISDAGASDLARIDAREAHDQVIRLMEVLDDREKQIVMARFGFDRDEDGVAFHVIAKEIGLSTTRTTQLFRHSLQKMRGLLSEFDSSTGRTAAANASI